MVQAMYAPDGEINQDTLVSHLLLINKMQWTRSRWCKYFIIAVERNRRVPDDGFQIEVCLRDAGGQQQQPDIQWGTYQRLRQAILSQFCVDFSTGTNKANYILLVAKGKTNLPISSPIIIIINFCK